MTWSSDPACESEHIFLRSDSASTKGTLCIVAGFAALGFAVLGFFLALLSRPGQFAFFAMTTAPVLVGIGALGAGRLLLGTPYQVIVSPEGLIIDTKRGPQRIDWDEVGSATVETGSMSHRRALNITDRAGKSIVRLDESFNGFDELVAIVSQQVEAKGDDTTPHILRKKARRNAALMFAVGLGMGLGCPFLAWTTHEEQRAARLLRAQGQPGKGEIVRRFVAPNGVTKRLEYCVLGSKVRNVEVEPAYWRALEGARTVPVVYVPNEPAISRLAHGEVRDRMGSQSPTVGYGMAALSGLFALVMLGGAPFVWIGWDLTHDSKTRKWAVKRFGKVVWSQ